MAFSGAYAEWIHCHPEVLSHVMPLLILGLGNKDIAPASTRALKEISRDCQQNMKPFAEQILTESQVIHYFCVLIPKSWCSTFLSRLVFISCVL